MNRRLVEQSTSGGLQPAACSLRPAAWSLRGAHAVEYAMLISIVVAAMVAMQTYVRRAVQAHLKNVELRLNASQ